MNPAKVVRARVAKLTDLPNVGPSIAEDLVQLGINTPAQLAGMCPYDMYERLCAQTRIIHDPCLLDVFISITRFMDGGAPRPWWHYTAARKRKTAGPRSDGVRPRNHGTPPTRDRKV